MTPDEYHQWRMQQRDEDARKNANETARILADASHAAQIATNQRFAEDMRAAHAAYHDRQSQLAEEARRRHDALNTPPALQKPDQRATYNQVVMEGRRQLDAWYRQAQRDARTEPPRYDPPPKEGFFSRVFRRR